jgi:dienelactone hydrolase
MKRTMARPGTQRSSPHHAAVSLVIASVLTTALVGCSGGSPSINVDHPTSLIDEAIHINVTGLSSGEKVTLRATTVDLRGQVMSSAATFVADFGGTVDVAHAAPVSGAYSGTDAMGPLWSMWSASTAELAPLGSGAPAPLNESVTLTLDAGGKTLARRTIVRQLYDPTVVVRHEVVAQEGFYGTYFAPLHVKSARPAILILGGSEGGLSSGTVSAAALLASHGYPTLAVAYFDAPGLPPSLYQLPLEYFAKALSWLRTQPNVDSRHLLTYGFSRGSQAALLLGAYYPGLVNGVIALSPSNVASCSVPGCVGPAWMLGGQPVPYTKLPDDPSPSDTPSAVIPVERILGPIFMSCGGADRVWTSCAYADAIVARLKAHHNEYSHTLLSYPQAGHGVGELVPYLPGADGPPLGGTSAASNQRAREQGWPRLLSFLGTVP